MGVKLMTGATGEQNIQAADDRECLAGITGLDSYVFPTGSQLKATLVDSNTVTIGTGAGSLQGSRFRCSTTTTVKIQSGTQGQFRHDIVGLHFSRETSGREGLEFQVLTGEPAASEGAATDPAYTAGDLLKGDAEAFMPLYRVKLSGINTSDPEPLFSVLTTLATLRDSVSQDHETLTSAKKKLDKIKLHGGNGKEVEFFTWGNNAQISIEGTGHKFSILFDARGVSLKDETAGKFLFQNH
jgi:hypothetical protein|nr:MAG TPA: hypothetical protein [Caudoviricetes sp.]